MTSRPVCLVVAYGRPDLLDSCLGSLSWSPGVTVVDNSRDDAVRSVAERHGAAYVRPPRNLGFAGGVNVGLSVLPDGDVLLVNPDAEVQEAAATSMSEALSGGHVAAVAPRLVHPDGSTERTRWPFPSPLVVWAGAVGLADRIDAPTFLNGAVLLLNRAALEQVGLFDERFFLYAEEADWQRRALQQGWDLVACPEAVATHVGSATSSDGEVRETLFHASAELYARKWFGRLGWLVFRLGALVSAARRSFLCRDPAQRRLARHVVRLYAGGPARAGRALHEAAA